MTAPEKFGSILIILSLLFTVSNKKPARAIILKERELNPIR